MSDQSVLAITTAAGAAFASYMTYKMAALTKVANATHKAVNSLSLILARRLADVSERLAAAVPTASNIEAAKDAQKALVQSEAVQDQLDQRKP